MSPLGLWVGLVLFASFGCGTAVVLGLLARTAWRVLAWGLRRWKPRKINRRQTGLLAASLAGGANGATFTVGPVHVVILAEDPDDWDESAYWSVRQVLADLGHAPIPLKRYAPTKKEPQSCP